MKLTYIYHSGFSVEGEGFTLIFDFYKDVTDSSKHKLVEEVLLHRPGKIYVFSSHSHQDHFNKEILAWKAKRPDLIYIFSSDILKRLKTPKDAAIYLSKQEVYQDETLKVQAFGSTDIGGSFLVEVAGKRIFHAGDLNNWHWKDESTEEEIRKAENDYLRELNLIAESAGQFDLVMFPVDKRLGTDYMRGAEQFVDKIATTLFSPMHFGEDYGSAAAFSAYAGKRNTQVICWKRKGENFEF